MIQAGYLVSSLLCISSISGLASQVTARQGNVLGILGVASGVLSSLVALGFSPEVLVQFGILTALGGTAGIWIGRRVTAMELPQTVAALHSVVGLAAVFTCIGSVLGDLAHASTLHLVLSYLGVLVGGVTFRYIVPSRSILSATNQALQRLDNSIPQTGRDHVVQTF